MRDRLIAGAMMPATLVNQAQKFRRWYRDRVLELFDEVDAILAPATPCTAPLIGQQTFVLDGVELPVRPTSASITQPISFIGLPVVAVPVPLKPLPIGVQIIAAPWREDVALRIAYALERRRGVALRSHASSRLASRSLEDEGGDRMEIDLPEVVAEVTAAFDRYETGAGVERCRDARLDLPRRSRAAIRYGGGENLYGYKEIEAFRAARSPVGLARTTSKTVITTYGRDFAVASTLFHRASMPGKVGRQMQTWVRFPEGWRVVAAHVSVIDERRRNDRPRLCRPTNGAPAAEARNVARAATPSASTRKPFTARGRSPSLPACRSTAAAGPRRRSGRSLPPAAPRFPARSRRPALRRRAAGRASAACVPASAYSR